ncbi:MAG TPA: hypothetical protein VEI02_16395, partial [Planctomycetota bacterium]|nr:hypothetical protein [Planctomycetota bacterium]
AFVDFAGPLGAGWSGGGPGEFPVGLLAGGSGGGGGGGAVAFFAPWLSVGGRGGNGGGALILLSDARLVFGPHARLLADGEPGRAGVDAFPVPNQEPLFILSVPGSGGGGSGGLVFGAAVADVEFAPTTLASAVTAAARGGAAGPDVTLVSTPNVGGGAGGAGRVRFAVNQHSSRADAVEASLLALIGAGRIAPSPSPLPAGLPAPAVDFFTYPSP